jgi:SAM-dependent methyltransferase
MAVTCPVDLDTMRLRQEIQSIYARVATDPAGAFHFHRGPAYAAELLGYDANALSALPHGSTDSFAGVANPHRIAPIFVGATVVDIGCGAGMDLLLAAKAVGPNGRAIGVDMTDAMAERTRAGARALGFDHVEVRLGDAMALPIESGTVDVVMSNGVLNLTPDKNAAFREVSRVLVPGGAFLYGDIVLAAELDESMRRDIDLWTG